MVCNMVAQAWSPSSPLQFGQAMEVDRSAWNASKHGTEQAPSRINGSGPSLFQELFGGQSNIAVAQATGVRHESGKEKANAVATDTDSQAVLPAISMYDLEYMIAPVFLDTPGPKDEKRRRIKPVGFWNAFETDRRTLFVSCGYTKAGSEQDAVIKELGEFGPIEDTQSFKDQPIANGFYVTFKNLQDAEKALSKRIVCVKLKNPVDPFNLPPMQIAVSIIRQEDRMPQTHFISLNNNSGRDGKGVSKAKARANRRMRFRAIRGRTVEANQGGATVAMPFSSSAHAASFELDGPMKKGSDEQECESSQPSAPANAQEENVDRSLSATLSVEGMAQSLTSLVCSWLPGTGNVAQ